MCIREEHSVIGGLLSKKLLTPGRRIGVGDEFGHSGPAVPPVCLKTENPSSEKPT